MNELALFAGAGGGILGSQLLGWHCVCAVEIDAYARRVLVARQNDGCLPPFPIWDDISTFDGRPWRGVVDVVSGGFPCQDISSAGRGAGITGPQSGLWSHMARIIGEVRPRYVWVENSPRLVQRGLNVVLADLAALGYDARWGVVGARDAGAPHKRDRIWIAAADAYRNREHDGAIDAEVAIAPEPMGHTQSSGLEGTKSAWDPRFDGRAAEHGPRGRKASWWEAEPDVGRVADGVASRMDRLRCIGNGQVPAVVALAWSMLRGTT
jgi:DNA (cytosine-5)-methyltransferase 1